MMEPGSDAEPSADPQVDVYSCSSEGIMVGGVETQEKGFKGTTCCFVVPGFREDLERMV